MDGMPTSRYCEFLCDSLAKNQIDHGAAGAPTAGLPEPVPLSFQLNAPLEKALAKAAQRFDDDVRRHDHSALCASRTFCSCARPPGHAELMTWRLHRVKKNRLHGLRQGPHQEVQDEPGRVRADGDPARLLPPQGHRARDVRVGADAQVPRRPHRGACCTPPLVALHRTCAHGASRSVPSACAGLPDVHDRVDRVGARDGEPQGDGTAGRA